MLRLILYIPEDEEKSKEVEKILHLLEEVQKVFPNMAVETKLMDKVLENKLKFDVLLKISVTQRIKIKQTKRTKSLYPQLVIYESEEPITFYPQARGEKEIDIENFLVGMLKGEVRCLHEEVKIRLAKLLEVKR